MNICNTIVKYCGRDMTSLNNEITKLSAYILQNGRNTVELCDIHEVSSFNNEIDTFDFSNAVLNGDSERAISIMSEMILHKEAPEIIMGTIINIFTDLYTVKILDEAGYIVVNSTQTSVKGVYAAGDAAERDFKQAVVASSSGAIAAIRAAEYLS
jgi:DNA polymerase III delta subunit